MEASNCECSWRQKLEETCDLGQPVDRAKRERHLRES